MPSPELALNNEVYLRASPSPVVGDLIGDPQGIELPDDLLNHHALPGGADPAMTQKRRHQGFEAARGGVRYRGDNPWGASPPV